ncbi:hypothetical protein [Motilibacter aurantiacus]|uniref:hypothetical protein n=1 Tax=Motilibacter aurantiacus TaxID=2714955 RepID=UPI00140B66FF|nr:hypothetical protein [Motilibacter aurantiacus]NHC46382.1 hypothetical protein [Motilibacter aurantiacus]
MHDVGYLLRQPYWLDESWVAVSTRVPLRDLPLVTASSPLGWTVLLRLVPFGGPERQRLVPLAFAGLAVALGYLLLRALGRGRLVAALAGALPVLIAPAMLVRDDLKQYTADAAVLLLLWLAVARLDAAWTRRRLVALGVLVGLAPLVSTAAALSGPAALVAVVGAALVAHDRARVREASLLALAAGAVLGVVLLLTVLRNSTDSLREFWVDHYLPRSPVDALPEAWSRWEAAAAYTLVPHALPALLLAAGGAWALWRSGKVASALLVPVAALGSAAAAVLHVYPFLDVRTSTWLLVGVSVLAAVAVAVALGALAAPAPAAPAAAIRLAATGLAVAAAGSAAHVAHPYVRGHTIFAQDVRSQAERVAADKRPGDVVLVALSATWAYAYYSGTGPVPVERTDSVATRFLPSFAGAPDVQVVRGRGPEAVRQAVRRAVGSAGPDGRVWVVRTQIAAEERPAWDAALRQCGQEVRVGVDPLLVLRAGGGCG